MLDMTDPLFPEFQNRWRVTEVKHPGVIWARYADAITLPVLQDVFGGTWPPLECRSGERVFAVRNPLLPARPFDPLDHPAAWLSLTINQFDPECVFMSRGVWPNEHGKGLGKFMRRWAEVWCKQNGIKLLTIWINASNKEHLDKVKADTFWSMSAIDFEPLAFRFEHAIEAMAESHEIT